MDPAAILALISELYGTITRLNAENQRLREQAAAAQPTPGEPPPPCS